MATMLNPNAIPDGSITQEKIDPSVLEGKVDKEEGKGLSSNDYTDAEKAKLTELGATVDSLTKGVPEKTIDYSSRPMTVSSYWLKGADGKISFASSGMGLRRVDVIDIAEGDTIIVDTDKGGASALPILICDKDDNVVLEQVSYTTKHYEITAESGYAKLYINSIKDTAFACSVHTPQRASEIDTIKKELESHDARITALEEGEQSQVAMPLIAPSPQLPANDKAESDFNAETVLSTDIQAYLDDIVANKQPIPVFQVSGTNREGCKYATMYDVVGKDASGQYDMKAYVLSRRNRFAYKASGKYYAWKNGTSLVYTQNRTPIVGDHIYNSNRQEISGNVASYNSGSQSISVNGTTYTRDDSATLGELVLYADYVFAANSRRNLFDKKNEYVSAADSMDGRTFVYGGNTYTRYSALDYHTDNKATIVIWANEHAAQSDPHEASIVLARMMNDLCSGGCRNNKMLQYLRKYCKVVLIPCANPYGINKWAENHREGRNNSNNVNINRNYDTTGWSVITDKDKGSSAGDQSETQFIMNLCNEIEPNIAIDIHCLSYTTALNDSKCHYEGRVFETENDKVKETMDSYFGLVYTSYGDANPDGGATGADWIYSRGWFGGLIEMNAGRYANSYNGNQHSDYTLEADYTLLLNTLAMWYHGYDPTVDFRKL